MKISARAGWRRNFYRPAPVWVEKPKTRQLIKGLGRFRGP
jgi:hypothetical protein